VPPPCPAICKSGGTCPRAPWSRRQWLLQIWNKTFRRVDKSASWLDWPRVGLSANCPVTQSYRRLEFVAPGFENRQHSYAGVAVTSFLNIRVKIRTIPDYPNYSLNAATANIPLRRPAASEVSACSGESRARQKWLDKLFVPKRLRQNPSKTGRTCELKLKLKKWFFRCFIYRPSTSEIKHWNQTPIKARETFHDCFIVFQHVVFGFVSRVQAT